ncbi:MAG: GNAT family N-acetyltransferase [Propionibacteriales bacterium]|nr:GNAT family N-acetyltransferase [Propionibacteriales bacterium]
MDTEPLPPILRPVLAADHEAVLAWNQTNVELLAPLDQARLDQLLGWADAGSVILAENAPVGFVITFAAGSAYDSSNYRWFSERHTDFLYLDRIVIDTAARRSGLGSRVYDAIEHRAAELGGVLCLEVNLEPPNEPSLAFHRRRGFVEVGRQEAGGHLVSLLEKQV